MLGALHGNQLPVEALLRAEGIKIDLEDDLHKKAMDYAEANPSA